MSMLIIKDIKLLVVDCSDTRYIQGLDFCRLIENKECG